MPDLGVGPQEPTAEELVAAFEDGATQAEVEAVADRGRAALPALRAGLKGDVRAVELGCIRTVGLLGLNATPLLPTLVERFHEAEDDPELALLASTALTDLGKVGARAVPRLAELLADDRLAVRVLAVWTLGGLSPHKKDAVAALLEHADEEPDVVALWIPLSLVRGGEKSIAELGDALKRGSHRKRFVALLAIGALGAAPKKFDKRIAGTLPNPKGGDFALANWDYVPLPAALYAIERLGERTLRACKKPLEALGAPLEPKQLLESVYAGTEREVGDAGHVLGLFRVSPEHLPKELRAKSKAYTVGWIAEGLAEHFTRVVARQAPQWAAARDLPFEQVCTWLEQHEEAYRGFHNLCVGFSTE